MNLKHKLIKITASATLFAFTFSSSVAYSDIPQTIFAPKHSTTTARNLSAVWADGVRSELRQFADQYSSRSELRQLTLDDLFTTVDDNRANPKRLDGLALPDGTKVKVLRTLEDFAVAFPQDFQEIRRHWDRHFSVFELSNEKLGYTAYVGIHRLTKITSNAPVLNGQWRATGGTRIIHYGQGPVGALIDALELSDEMSFKNAGANLKIGGSKSAIHVFSVNPKYLKEGDKGYDPENARKRENILISYAHGIETIGRLIGGGILTGQDVNIAVPDAQLLDKHAPTSIVPFVSKDHGSRLSTPPTAVGVEATIEAGIEKVFPESPTLKDKVVIIYGLGGVGGLLVEPFLKKGAIVIGSDIEPASANQAPKTDTLLAENPLLQNYVKEGRLFLITERILERDRDGNPIKYTRHIIDPFSESSPVSDQLKAVGISHYDVVSPSAIGPSLNDETAPVIIRNGAKLIGGAENNVLENRQKHSQRFHDNQVVLVPDFIANGGGVNAVNGHLLPKDESTDEAIAARIHKDVLALLDESIKRNVPPEVVAHEKSQAYFEALERAPIPEDQFDPKELAKRAAQLAKERNIEQATLVLAVAVANSKPAEAAEIERIFAEGIQIAPAEESSPISQGGGADSSFWVNLNRPPLFAPDRSELRQISATYLKPEQELKLLYHALTQLERSKGSSQPDLPIAAIISDQHGTIDRFDALIVDAINQVLPGQLPADFKLNPNKALQDQLAVHGVTFDDLRQKIFFHNLGDLMDRGPYGVKVFHRSAELIDAGLSDFVPGNHDLWMFMNLQGFHLPFYEGYNFYGDHEAETIADRYRKETPEAKTKTWWAERLAEFTAFHEKRQKEYWDALEVKVNGAWTDEKRKKRVEGSGLYKQVSASLNGDAEQTRLWNQFRGWYLVDIYTGVRAVGTVSIPWWEDLLEGFKKAYASVEAAQGFDAELPANQAWREAIRMMSEDILPELKKDLQSFVDQGKDWAKVFEAVNRQNYTSPEWWAKDWVFHKDWGTAVIKELNENLPADAKVTSANYLENHTLDRIADFFKAQFHLYQRDAYQNVYMHAFLPVDMQTGEFFFTYKGVEYRGKGHQNHPSVWQGLDIVARDIRSNPSLSEIYEALNLVNSWYADNTTVIKVPNVAAAINKFGAQKVAAVNGFNRLFTGHLPFHEFAKKLTQDKRGMIGGFQVDSRIIFTDHGMGERFGGRGGWIGVSLRNGIQLRGFEHANSNQVVADARTVETKEGPSGLVEAVLFENKPVSPESFTADLARNIEARIAQLQSQIESSDRQAVYKEYLSQFSAEELKEMLKAMRSKLADMVNYLHENLAALSLEDQDFHVTELVIINEHIALLEEAIKAAARSELRNGRRLGVNGDLATLGLHSKIIGTLRLNGITTISQLTDWSATELRNLSGVGPGSLRQIQAALASAGKSLRREKAPSMRRSELRFADQQSAASANRASRASRASSELRQVSMTGLDLSNYADVMAFVQAQAAELGAERIEVVDVADDDRLLAEEVAAGKLVALPDGNFYTRSHPEDVARSEDKTFVATKDEKDKGLFNNWRHTDELKAPIEKLMQGSLKGKTLYVIPYIMGPANSPFSQAGIELTDSRYVALNMIRMTRVGKVALEEIQKKGKFTRGIHVTGNLDQLAAERKADPKNDKRAFASFPDENLILSYGSAYGGNALLGKKFHALRQAMYDGVKEGWLAEHMFMLELEDLQTGEIKRVAGAYPSASGKTNAAMMKVVNHYKDRYKIYFFSDDILWIRKKGDQLYAINPERGLFGVVPGTNGASNPNAMEAISKPGKTLFTNVAYNEITGKLWWEGHDLPRPDEEAGWRNWKGELIANLPAERKNEPWAHPNSRFTTSIDNVSNKSPDWENPEGVPIDEVLFGGRIGSREVLIRETRTIEEGVYDGLTMGVETTAAATGKVGVFREDPMAQRPFFSPNEGDYVANWIRVLRSVKNPPKIFHVNWFRKGSDGKFFWAGYGYNLIPILWGFERTAHPERTDNIIPTPFGNIPAPGALDMDGLHMDPVKFQEMLSIDEAAWSEELTRRTKWLSDFEKKFPGRMPKEIFTEHERVVNEWTQRIAAEKIAKLGIDQEALARAENAKRTPVIGGNWKMNVQSWDDARSLLVNVVNGLIVAAGRVVEVFVAPSHSHLAIFKHGFPFTPPISRFASFDELAGSVIPGAQDVAVEEKGAFTGDVSIHQLKDVGVQYVIVGHSERRHGAPKESDELINKKVHVVLKNGLNPVLAVGELLAERDSFKTFDVLERQIREGLKNVTAEQMAKVVIAYEPVWAIGTGRTATPDQANQAHRFIRALLLDLYGEKIASETRIQYGGSMNPKNASQLMAEINVDGGLIGGASLKADEFTSIVQAADESARSELRTDSLENLTGRKKWIAVGTFFAAGVLALAFVPTVRAVGLKETFEAYFSELSLGQLTIGVVGIFGILAAVGIHRNNSRRTAQEVTGGKSREELKAKSYKLSEIQELMIQLISHAETKVNQALSQLSEEDPQHGQLQQYLSEYFPRIRELILQALSGEMTASAAKNKARDIYAASSAAINRFRGSGLASEILQQLEAAQEIIIEVHHTIDTKLAHTRGEAYFEPVQPQAIYEALGRLLPDASEAVNTVEARSELRTGMGDLEDGARHGLTQPELAAEHVLARPGLYDPDVPQDAEAIRETFDITSEEAQEAIREGNRRSLVDAVRQSATEVEPEELRSELRGVDDYASLNPFADQEKSLKRLSAVVQKSLSRIAAPRSELRRAVSEFLGLNASSTNTAQAPTVLIALSGFFEYGPLLALIQQNLSDQHTLIARPGNPSEFRVIEAINAELIAAGFKPVPIAENDRQLTEILRETRSQLRYALGTSRDKGTAEMLYARGILQSPEDLITPTSRQFEMLTGLAGLTADIMNRYRSELRTSMAA